MSPTNKTLLLLAFALFIVATMVVRAFSAETVPYGQQIFGPNVFCKSIAALEKFIKHPSDDVQESLDAVNTGPEPVCAFVPTAVYVIGPKDEKIIEAPNGDILHVLAAAVMQIGEQRLREPVKGFFVPIFLGERRADQ